MGGGGGGGLRLLRGRGDSCSRGWKNFPGGEDYLALIEGISCPEGGEIFPSGSENPAKRRKTCPKGLIGYQLFM